MAVGVAKPKDFAECNTFVHFWLMLDSQKNYGKYLRNSLDAGLPVLIYNGMDDFLCNWKGAEVWTNSLVWRNQNSFKGQFYRKWKGHDGQEAGEFKTEQNFTFLKVYNAGHMVPTDQPHNALLMLQQWIETGTVQESQG